MWKLSWQQFWFSVNVDWPAFWCFRLLSSPSVLSGSGVLEGSLCKMCFVTATCNCCLEVSAYLRLLMCLFLLLHSVPCALVGLHLWLARVTGCEAGVFFWWRYLWLSRYLAGCGLCFVAPWCIPQPHDFMFRNVASVGVFLSLVFLFPRVM